MGKEITFKINGLAELEKRVAESPKLVQREITRAITGSIQELSNRARKETPYRTGVLRRSIKYKMDSPLRGIVDAEAFYAIFVHEGTRFHPTPNPFFIRAIEQANPRIKTLFEQAIQNVVAELAR